MTGSVTTLFSNFEVPGICTSNVVNRPEVCSRPRFSSEFFNSLSSTHATSPSHRRTYAHSHAQFSSFPPLFYFLYYPQLKTKGNPSERPHTIKMKSGLSLVDHICIAVGVYLFVTLVFMCGIGFEARNHHEHKRYWWVHRVFLDESLLRPLYTVMVLSPALLWPILLVFLGLAIACVAFIFTLFIVLYIPLYIIDNADLKHAKREGGVNSNNGSSPSQDIELGKSRNSPNQLAKDSLDAMTAATIAQQWTPAVPSSVATPTRRSPDRLPKPSDSPAIRNMMQGGTVSEDDLAFCDGVTAPRTSWRT